MCVCVRACVRTRHSLHHITLTQYSRLTPGLFHPNSGHESRHRQGTAVRPARDAPGGGRKRRQKCGRPGYGVVRISDKYFKCYSHFWCFSRSDFYASTNRIMRKLDLFRDCQCKKGHKCHRQYRGWHHLFLNFLTFLIFLFPSLPLSLSPSFPSFPSFISFPSPRRRKYVGVSGLAITKLDGTARGLVETEERQTVDRREEIGDRREERVERDEEIGESRGRD